MSKETKNDAAKEEIKQAQKQVQQNAGKKGCDTGDVAQKKDSNDAKIAELTDDLKKLQAEFENYKKRSDKECASFREYAKADLIKKMLPILDTFDIALKNTNNHDDFVKGIELLYSQIYSLLKEEGLEYIDTKGKKFDPYLHEVMLCENSDKEEESVLEEFQKGYKLKGAVLRHSKVKVAKK
jgi:molecular chaperone GrpE